MKRFRTVAALLLCLAMLLSMGVYSGFAAEEEIAEVEAATGITIHYYCTKGTPSVYYWNALPKNLETAYPGVKMTSDADSGTGWFKYTFSSSTKINLMFTDGTSKLSGQLSEELTRNAGEWWYKNDRWYSYNPDKEKPDNLGDFREETIYFVITTRFYDGDKGNNVHCWDDAKANNPDSDPAWRGDFKGLADKLDYIKALGFSAIWITPVVENASGYDYHGYHAMDFSKVDARYESSGFTFQDLIDAAHSKGMKIVQDVVWNHTGNFGEAHFAPMFEKEYSSLKDLESISSMKLINGSKLQQAYPNYDNMDGDAQYQVRLAIMKNTDGKNHDSENYYHHFKDLSWESPTVQTGQIAGDCVDLNTENKEVAEYLVDTYSVYVDMGVDAFRLDTEKHISRLTLNELYFPQLYSNAPKGFFLFGEVCTRVSEFWNHGIPAISAPFYGWAETDAKWKNVYTSNQENNVNLSLSHYDAHSNTNGAPTSNNVYLNGITYHTPDYSKSNGTGVIDFPMHWNFSYASNAYQRALEEDSYYNDSTWNVVYVDSHDYGPNMDNRFNGDTQTWAESLSLMFTFRGIPCLYYGSEVQFQAGVPMDVGPGAPLSTTGRAYYGDYLEGTVTASDFSKYTASGKVQSTLNSPLSKHISKLNAVRRAIPALQKGQYTTDGNYVSGYMSYIRRYTNASEGVDSLALVSVSNGATFKNIPNGLYIDAITGDKKTVTNGTLTVNSIGKANARVYVCCASGFTGISGAIGETNLTYLK
ncbi:MAG: starch-binding protein [Clostridia bacterium]|nr:starch-binding protein [Clostridia bacterium]